MNLIEAEGLKAGGGGSLVEKLQSQMAAQMEHQMGFQMFAADLQRQQSTFNTVMHAKQQLMKDLTDIARDSIQKGGPN